MHEEATFMHTSINIFAASGGGDCGGEQRPRPPAELARAAAALPDALRPARGEEECLSTFSCVFTFVHLTGEEAVPGVVPHRLPRHLVHGDHLQPEVLLPGGHPQWFHHRSHRG